MGTQKKKKLPKLGSGQRFKNLKKTLAAKGAKDPGALAAFIGRKKLGKGKMAKLSVAGKKRKATKKGAKLMLHQKIARGQSGK